MAKCKRGTIKFKTKRGKTIQFSGRKGADCGPRKKPSTAHLRVFKSVMKDAAPSCKRGARGSVKAYRKCIGAAVRQAARG